jgi:cytochrome oxidase Cu insertion factor (SCO1/SenC/PrrC family)
MILALASVALALATAVGYGSLLSVAAVRNHPALYLAGFALAVVLAAFAVARRRGWLSFAALAFAVLLLLAGSYFNFVMARMPAAAVAVRTGEPAPDFTLSDASGAPVTLSSLRGRRPVVIVFYRGAW